MVFAHVVSLLSSNETGKFPIEYWVISFFFFKIFRHGHRNALEGYPNDPYKDEALYWPEGYGQLTNVKLNIFRFIETNCSTNNPNWFL